MIYPPAREASNSFLSPLHDIKEAPSAHAGPWMQTHPHLPQVQRLQQAPGPGTELCQAALALFFPALCLLAFYSLQLFSASGMGCSHVACTHAHTPPAWGRLVFPATPAFLSWAISLLPLPHPGPSSRPLCTPTWCLPLCSPLELLQPELHS